ncbi:MAG: hypothetical protein GY842_28885 [bacterium]|nr:hypothetical protein [bacterium]
MDLLKRNLFFIICGLGATAGIALGALGLKSMGQVRTRIREAQTLLQQLGSAANDTVNFDAITAEQRRVSAVQGHYLETVEWSHALNRQEPLVPGVFPEPGGDKKLEFKDAYLARIKDLRNSLKAGQPPDDREVYETRITIENEKPRAAEPPTGETGAPVAPPSNRSGLITDDASRKSAPARAALVKARGMYCYADSSALHVIDEMYSGGLQLSPEVLWDAQRTLWVQSDVVAALRRINERAVRRLQEAGVTPWVGVLPIKDLFSIRVSDYVMEDSDGAAPARASGDGPAQPPGTPAESFTGYFGNDLYDVLHFTVKLAVDQRYVPAIVDEIGKLGDDRYRFYTPLRVAYQAVPANLDMTDKIYGEDPVVRVVIDYEAYYFGDIYRRLMPDAILDELGLERPEEDEPSE